MKTKPKTTPECEHLIELVLEGLKANPLEFQKKENAKVALQRLCKKKCTKAIEYIMEESSHYPLIDAFAQKICEEARKNLKELSS